MELMKRSEIKATVEAIKVEDIEKSERPAMEIMEGYIWGKYARNQHYKVEDIQAILDEVKSAKEVVEQEEPVKVAKRSYKRKVNTDVV